MALNLIPFILQSLIMLGIIIAMNFTVTQLRVMVNNSPWVPSTPLQVRYCFGVSAVGCWVWLRSVAWQEYVRTGP